MELIIKILWQLLMMKNILRIKKSGRMMNSHKRDNEKMSLIEEVTKIVIDEVI